MTTKEQAEKLYNKMYGETPVRTVIEEIEKDKQYAKKCALIAVDVILNDVMLWWEIPVKDEYFITQKTYWEEIKQEIEKL
jgi:hypothetical protein